MHLQFWVILKKCPVKWFVGRAISPNWLMVLSWIATGHMLMEQERKWPIKAIQLSYHELSSSLQWRLCSFVTDAWVAGSCSIQLHRHTKWPVRFWLAHPESVSGVKWFLDALTMKVTHNHPSFVWDCMNTQLIGLFSALEIVHVLNNPIEHQEIVCSNLQNVMYTTSSEVTQAVISSTDMNI